MTSKFKCPKCGKESDLESNIVNEEDILDDFMEGSRDKLNKRIKELELQVKAFGDEPFIVAKVVKAYMRKKTVIKIANGNKFYVDTLGKLKLKVGDEVLCQNSNLKVVAKLD